MASLGAIGHPYFYCLLLSRPLRALRRFFRTISQIQRGKEWMHLAPAANNILRRIAPLKSWHQILLGFVIGNSGGVRFMHA